MKLDEQQIKTLKSLMANSAQKGNLANAGIVFENGKAIAESESLVASNHDATDHSERMLVSRVCREKKNNYTPGLAMVTVIEPCLMCISACAQAGYEEIAYVIPADRYIERIPWVSDVRNVDKQSIASSFDKPLTLTHLREYEDDFSVVFENAMSKFLE